MPSPKSDKRDPPHLVSEARPIPFADLSEDEQKLITNRADPWIEAVVKASGFEKPAADEIDEHRTGRVLFIDGPRGAGKTSFLLTLLNRWNSSDTSGRYGSVSCRSKLRVFLPVLDFDPLPHGMPLHGWLLEPWRKRAQELDKKPISGSGGADSGDLTEQFADLFERAIIGWTPEHIEGKGVVQKALAYQERVDGWIETHGMWNKFVGSMVCRSVGCYDANCKHAHQVVFVVAIDDVDLQIEHLPQLIHAIRLFHHPNVAYVLTGNYEHLQFALLLNYLRRHEHQTDRHNPKTPWNEIDRHSKNLRDAFLEKALPSHARLELRHLSLDDVLKFAVGDARKVEHVVAEAALTMFPPVARELKIVTARRAQHATDRLAKSLEAIPKEEADKSGARLAHSLEFIADLCGTTIATTGQFAERGSLTTQLGTIARAWEGRNRLTIWLAEQPRFVFFPNYDQDNILTDELAHGAVLAQVATEANPSVRALALNWAPDELVLATEVRWYSSLAHVEGIAVFHWPVLVRPTASQVLHLKEFTKLVNAKVGGNSQTDVNEDMVVAWLWKNIEWLYLRDNHDVVPVSQLMEWHDAQNAWPKDPAGMSLSRICDELKHLSQFGSYLKDETKRWTCELIVMTAPYFGLPEELADKMRGLLSSIDTLALSADEIKKQEKLTVRNATIAPRAVVARLRRKPLDQKVDLTSSDYNELDNNFLEAQGSASARESWWQWPGRIAKITS